MLPLIFRPSYGPAHGPIGPPKFSLNIRNTGKKRWNLVHFWLAQKLLIFFSEFHTKGVSIYKPRVSWNLKKQYITVYKYLLDITFFKGWCNNKFSCTATYTWRIFSNITRARPARPAGPTMSSSSQKASENNKNKSMHFGTFNCLLQMSSIKALFLYYWLVE